jgi:iron complex transport system substrate-binding protein
MKRVVLALYLLVAHWVVSAQADVDLTRIASVDANATEILMSFHLTDHLVAVDMTSQPLVKNKNLPDLGYHRALSTEGLLSTEPTLVIGSTHMGPPTVVESLEATEIDLIRLDAASNIDGLLKNIQQLGQALHKKDDAEQLSAYIQQQADAIEKKHQGESLSMIFLLDLTGRGLSKAGQGTTGESLVAMLGGQNLADYAGYKNVSMEAVLELNPDVILVGSREFSADAAAELLAANPLLKLTSAVKNNRLLSVDASVMVAGVSPGVIDEALRLSNLIYP